MAKMTFDIATKRVPRHTWFRVAGGWMPNCDRGHGWLYANIVRRDAWKLGPFALVILRMPKRRWRP